MADRAAQMQHFGGSQSQEALVKNVANFDIVWNGFSRIDSQNMVLE